VINIREVVIAAENIARTSVKWLLFVDGVFIGGTKSKETY
jgi:hypothetical protein